MRLCGRVIPIAFAGRIGRALAGLTVLPALLLTQQALLIHNHHGHDVHCHPIALDGLDDWERNPEHRHDEHEHDGRPVDPQSGSSGPIVIVFDLPDFAPGVRVLSGASLVSARRAPVPVTVATLSDPGTRRLNPSARSLFFRRVPRAGDTIKELLLSNHALLL